MSERGPLSTDKQLDHLRDAARSGHKLPPMPEDLLPAEVVEWERLAAQLSNNRTGTVNDVGAMTRLVQLRVQWAQLQTRIARDGMFAEDRRGEMKIAPWAALSARIQPAILRLEREFGLTPSSKPRVLSVPKETEGGHFNKYRG